MTAIDWILFVVSLGAFLIGSWSAIQNGQQKEIGPSQPGGELEPSNQQPNPREGTAA